jgi:hypothetical protein
MIGGDECGLGFIFLKIYKYFLIIAYVLAHFSGCDQMIKLKSEVIKRIDSKCSKTILDCGMPNISHVVIFEGSWIFCVKPNCK